LHAIDVIDPKAKVPPTEVELRSRYLDNIAKLVNDQANLCTFELSIGAAKNEVVEPRVDEDPESPDVESSAAARIKSLFPFNALSQGRIAFDAEAAASVPTNEDIRAREDLWSCKFFFFLLSVCLRLFRDSLCLLQ
jgi:hypothetical protein